MRNSTEKEMVASLSPAHPSFDYGEVERSVAIFLQGQASRLRRYIGKSLIQVGKDLIAAKRYLSRGAFIRWVECEVGIPARTAQGYMRIAQWVEGKGAKAMQLAPSLLYLLSAQTTPREIAAEVLSATEAGETVSVSAVRERLRALRTKPHSDPCPSIKPHLRRTSLISSNEPDQMLHWNEYAEDELAEVAHILYRNLSGSDQKRVCQIMMNPNLLRDRKLAQRLLLAFARLSDGEFEQTIAAGALAFTADISAGQLGQ